MSKCWPARDAHAALVSLMAEGAAPVGDATSSALAASLLEAEVPDPTPEQYASILPSDLRPLFFSLVEGTADEELSSGLGLVLDTYELEGSYMAASADSASIAALFIAAAYGRP